MVRRDLRLWLGALACALVVGIAGSQDVYWNGDFDIEAFPAYKLLMAGDVHGYLQHLPGYTGFALAIGAPATLLSSLLGGADTMVFRLCALPGLVALAGLAVALAGHARRAHLKGWPLVLVLTAAGPLVLQTLKNGHPEDLLATAAAVGAVLAARSGRPTAAGLLLVVAVLAKQWAVLAIGPALLAAPAGHWRIAVIATLGSLAIVGAEILCHPVARGGLTSTADLFHPHQVWWPFGVAAPPDFIASGHGPRTSPDWLRPITHPLIVALALPLTLAAWRRPGRRADDALALLALLFLARCALDPWNLVYYHLPLVTALTAWEAGRGRAWPLLGLATSAAAWLSFITIDDRTSNLPFLVYMAWTIPLAVLLVRELYVARAPLPSRRPWPVDQISGARLSSPSTSTT